MSIDEGLARTVTWYQGAIAYNGYTTLRQRRNSDESRPFLRRSWDADAGVFRDHSQANGEYRISADSLARNEVLCSLRSQRFHSLLGHRADYVKDYFLNYNECISNDFVLSKGGKVLKLYSSDIDDWSVTFVDTGTNSNIGQRLKAVQKYLEGEEVFLANYSDGLTDLPINEQIEHFEKDQKIASFSVCKAKFKFSLYHP